MPDPIRQRMRDVIRRAVDDPMSRFPRPAHQPERLQHVADPRPAPSFRIAPGESVFTIGSCFARNIEEHLVALGFDVPSLDFSVLPGEFKGPRRNGILNKYTPAAIRAEVEAASRPDDTGLDLPLIDTADGRVVDVALASDVAVTRERGTERRRQVRELFRRGFEADIVVITLGQTESWWDRTGEQYCNIFPPASIHRHHDGRFDFEQLGYEQCLADVCTTIDLLRSAGRASRCLLSVSPVPLGRTFTGEDALTAYVRSKSVLRAVADAVTTRFDGVDYLPTYEAVMLTDRALAFDGALHVTDEVVGTVVRRMLSAYVGFGDTANASDVSPHADRNDSHGPQIASVRAGTPVASSP